MKKLSAGLLALALTCVTPLIQAQEAKPYKEGQVVEVSYIRTKPGRFDDYMQWLATSYRPLMEANKKAGLIVGYRIFAAQPRHPNEPDLILTITVPNMAALDRIEESEAIATKVMGSMATQNKATAERGSLREVLGSELIRELVLK